QPPPPISPVRPHDLRFAGRGSAEKRQDIAANLAKRDAGAVVLTSPPSIAWLLNLRGADVPCTPLALAYAILDAAGEIALFMDLRKAAPDLAEHLGSAVQLRSMKDFEAALDALGRDGGRVMVDPAVAPVAVFDRLESAGAEILRAADPCILPKARKTKAELDGTRAAHIRDGAALVGFLAWLEAAAPAGKVTELAAAKHLTGLRAALDMYRGVSFEPISGAGPNGAVVHYRVTEATNRTLAPGDLYLVDSGGQYLDGTTDVTRTVLVRGAGAEADAEARDRFTRVLKGHITLARAVFPAGTTGAQLDVLARGALWRGGVDFDHGTGHGVGSYLGVHEGPQGISKRSHQALDPGMIVSNEPGYYKTGAYGIRIENLVVVATAEPAAGGERPMLGFETITLAPIDRALIEPALMTSEETAWLDAYHARVRETLSPLLDRATAAWLAEATRPLGSG
ncbi:MAG: aminopeptidase P family protein, partial [Rhodospirillaceae bacterium]|nr:aminopeptidase P family protein [Rhodospirillaceae bacterium]